MSEDHNKARHGIESPGPMVYKLKGAFGKQDASRAANQPAWVFSSTNRFKYDHLKRAATSPGPGSYTLGASVGPQVASTKTSAPAPGFGTSDRDHVAKLYLSPEHEKLQAGVHSPGDAAATPPARSCPPIAAHRPRRDRPRRRSDGLHTPVLDRKAEHV